MEQTDSGRARQWAAMGVTLILTIAAFGEKKDIHCIIDGSRLFRLIPSTNHRARSSHDNAPRAPRRPRRNSLISLRHPLSAASLPAQ